MTVRLDRRRFLGHAAFFTVVPSALVACGGGNDDGEPAGRYAFPQGIASGDPKESSVVFWSRAVRTDAGQADVAVTLQVSTSVQFASAVAEVKLVASAAYDFTVRAKVTGLAPGTPLFYRFKAGSDTSPMGSAKTAPVSTSVAPVRFAWFTCQDWSVNHWGAMSLMAAENLDFLVHVGDYVYETVGASFQVGAAEPAHAAIRFPNGTSSPAAASTRPRSTTTARFTAPIAAMRGCRRCMRNGRSS